MPSSTQNPDKVYQIKITLTDAQPAIWRRIVSERAVTRPQWIVGKHKATTEE